MKTMKYIKSALLLMVAGMLFASCDPDAENWSAGEKTAIGCTNIYIANKATNVVELDPAVAPTFDITLRRPAANSTNAAAVKVAVTENDSNLFSLADSAVFEAGDSVTTVKVTVDTASSAFVQGDAYALKIKLEGDNVNVYKKNIIMSTYNFTVLKWENIGAGYMYDNVFAKLFRDIDDVLMQLPRIEKAVTSTETRYRFHSPYAGVSVADPDENGAFDYYPYTGAADITNASAQFLIYVNSDGAFFKSASLGIDYGYGTMSFYSTKYCTLVDGVISIPEGSMGVTLPSYGSFGIGNVYIFLSKAAYVAWKAKQVS